MGAHGSITGENFIGQQRLLMTHLWGQVGGCINLRKQEAGTQGLDICNWRGGDVHGESSQIQILASDVSTGVVYLGGSKYKWRPGE